jgi:hypothetical protein
MARDAVREACHGLHFEDGLWCCGQGQGRFKRVGYAVFVEERD